MSRSTRITLICHGETALHRVAGFGADEALLEGEADKAQKLASLLPHAHKIVSSPALCARQTAAAVARDFLVDPAFADLDCGRWRGRSLAEVHTSEPEGLATWIADADAAPHGGEAISALLKRVSDWMQSHIDGGGHEIVVTHAAVIRCVVIALLGASATAFWKIDVAPLSLTEITSDGRRWALRSLGRTGLD